MTFWGAARTVTGSLHQLNIQGKSYLLDCGLFQGRRQEAEERNRKFPFFAHQMSAVMLSHAHIDHSGTLPLLVKNGFNGPIYASPGTVDLCRPMLTDSASLQEKDAEFINKRYLRRKSINMNGGHPVEPLYTTPDAEATFALFRPTPMHTPTPIGPGVQYTSFEAGHIFGSTSMVLDLESDGRKVRLGFSGDLGRPGLPIVRDPEPLPGRRLSNPRKHVWRPHSRANSICGGQACGHRESYISSGRKANCAGFRSGTDTAVGVAAA